MAPDPLISVVIPVYNEAECLRPLHARLSAVLRGAALRHELIFVDDGSTDPSLSVINAIQAEDAAVSAVVLSRNFGHQAALTAGLEYAKGDAAITMDADLQHPPELILALLGAWRSGAKVVHAVRTRTEGISWPKRAASSLFYGMLGRLSSTPIHPNAADFRLLDRQAVDALRALKERHRFLRGMIGWIGLPQAVVPFEAPARGAGRSKYTWSKMLRMGADAVVSFSILPLRLSWGLGCLMLLLNLGYAGHVLYVLAAGKGAVTGWSSIVILIMLIGSAQLILLGIIGEYLGRIYEEAKGRPLYIVREISSGRGR